MDQGRTLKSRSRDRIFECGNRRWKVTLVDAQLSRDFLAVFTAEYSIEKLDTPLHRQRHRRG